MRAWLHDRVLQHLEYLAAGGYADADAAALMRVAAHAADELRAYVDGNEAEPPRDLGVALTQVAADARLLARGMQIRVVVGPEALELPSPSSTRSPARPARRSPTWPSTPAPPRAKVRVDVAGGAVVVRIADDGAGFDPAASPWMGLRHSVLGRLTAVGGTAVLEASPGAGTPHLHRPPPQPTTPEVVA